MGRSGFHKPRPGKKSSGRRADLDNRFFRSRWEANYARYLNRLVSQGLIYRWEYEKDTFWFDGIKRGVRSYQPDFKIWTNELTFYYIELKGWLDKKSLTKIKRLKKYFPKIFLKVVEAPEYRQIEISYSQSIVGWEYDPKKDAKETNGGLENAP